LDDTVAEVREEMKKGEVLVEITLIEKFWLDKPFFDAVVERCSPTATFARYGLLEALPAHSIRDFRGKFMRPAPKALSDTQEWTTMFCSQCPPERRLESSRCVKAEIAQQYAEKKLPFLCHRCRDSEAEARKFSAQT
jgi:hypothetical protein